MRRVFVFVALFGAACSSGPPEASAPPAPVPAPASQSPATTAWFFMGDAGLAIPSTCTATCDLQCDVWAGVVQCGDARLRIYGGFTSMAGMALNAKGAELEGQSTMARGGTLRWGIGTPGEFCASILDGEWNWEICGRDDESHRRAVLGLTKDYSVDAPKARLIDCPNSGC
jgi:hypothetical protein